MHYYQHNIADYRKDTAHLTLLEHGIYRQLMDTYYLDEKPIETQSVIRRLSIKTEEEAKALNNVLNDFFTLSECGNFHSKKRCDEEIIKYQAKAESARVNGQKGGRPKKPRKTQPVILANPNITQTKANHKPLTINQEPLTKENKPLSGKPDDEAKNPVDIVLDHLNAKRHSNYRNTKSNASLITARLNEGYNVECMIRVIDMKNREWSGDSKMEKFIRPATLFNATKFNQYAGELNSVDTNNSIGGWE
jgi:uncharacterized phage protein (TIGR02220 family)